MKFAQLTDFVLDLLFPRRCTWCDQVVGFSACEECDRQSMVAKLPDAPLVLHDDDRTAEFLGLLHACYRYQNPVDKAILRFKFNNEPALATTLGDCLIKTFENCGLQGYYDLIIPVPISQEATKTRGFNQSALMAARLSHGTGVAYQENVLVKHRNTERQMLKNREERIVNVKDAFRVDKPVLVEGKRILLIDDVVTTGSTLNECAKALRVAGALFCGALCVASA